MASQAEVFLAGAGQHPDSLEGVPAILAFLEAQRRELHMSQRQDDEQKAGELRWQATARAGRFVGGLPWRRPSASLAEFSKAGHLVAKYLEPLPAACASRPAKTQESPRTHPPFLNTNSVPRLFGEKEEPLVLAGVSRALAAGYGGAGGSPRLSPRAAKVANLQATHAPPAWRYGNATPRALDAAR